MEDALASPQNYLALIACFATLALLLAATGLYGVMSYLVGQHARDIGIHMALGCDSAAVSRLVVARGCCWWWSEPLSEWPPRSP